MAAALRLPRPAGADAARLALLTRGSPSPTSLAGDPHHHPPPGSRPAGGDTVAAGQVPERPVRGHAHVDRARHARLPELLDPRRAAGREPADLVRAVLLEEVAVSPRLAQARLRRGIERAAGDAATLVVAVGVKRVLERRRVRGPLGDRPAVVGAADKLVHLLETRAAHVVDEDAAGSGMNVERERVAKPAREDRAVAAARLGGERVVAGDAPVLSHPQDLPRRRSETVRQ